MTAKAATLTPNPLYGWDPAKHTLTATLTQKSGYKQVYEVRDNGTVLGYVVSRPASGKAREWDYATTAEGAMGSLVFSKKSRHDAAAALLEHVTRQGR